MNLWWVIGEYGCLWLGALLLAGTLLSLVAWLIRILREL